MPNPRLLLALLALTLATLFAPQTASAETQPSVENRVRAFSAGSAKVALGEADLTPELHYEKLCELRRLASGSPLAAKGGPKLLGQGTRHFAGDEAVQHFGKHGSGVARALGRDSYNLAQYVDDANHVIRNGTWVPELNGWTKVIGGPGSAKAAFVGVDRGVGYITTFHVKSVKALSKKAPSLGWVP